VFGYAPVPCYQQVNSELITTTEYRAVVMRVRYFIQHNCKYIFGFSFFANAFKEFLKRGPAFKAGFFNFERYAPVIRSQAIKVGGPHPVYPDFPFVGQNLDLICPWAWFCDQE
jgi:hypothetical protein